MNIANVFRVFGVLIMFFSVSMIPPLVISLFYQDGGWIAFSTGFIITLLSGFFCWYWCRNAKEELKARDGFLIVAMFWIVLSIFGAIPLMIAQTPSLSFTDAVFETVSGFTTTGSSVLTEIDYLPHAVAYYRQQLQFLGGMGIVVLAVAILPMLGIGGMQLYRAEVPGPAKDAKMTPRITQTAKALWYIYVGLVVLCAFAYWAAGMSFFDAVGESFATISTGGFSMHDTSFAYYHSDTIALIGAFFMFLGGTNFTLHFIAIQKQTLGFYWKDEEFRLYIGIIAFTVLVTMGMLLLYQIYPDYWSSFVSSLFNVVSIMTTTGFLSAPFYSWPTFVPIFLILVGMVGACAASTSGGIKLIRVLLLYKQGTREVQRLIHPNAVIPARIGKQILSDNLLQAVWGFVVFFIVIFIVIMLLLMACGLD
ncbi:MAG: potassium transporter TrkG, partial [Gammaproteobacteria bacterium]